MGHRYDWLLIGVLNHDNYYSQFEKLLFWFLIRRKVRGMVVSFKFGSRLDLDADKIWKWM